MITKDTEVYAALISEIDEKHVHAVYPDDWENLPVIIYTPEDNYVGVIASGDDGTAEEAFSTLIYRIDVYAQKNKPVFGFIEKINKAMSSLGFTRMGMMNYDDPEGYRHSVLRFTGSVSNKTGIVYREY